MPLDLITFFELDKSWLTLFFHVSSSPISNWDSIFSKSYSLLNPWGLLAKTISIFFYKLRSLLGLSFLSFCNFWIFDWTATIDLPNSLATSCILFVEIVILVSMIWFNTSISCFVHNLLCFGYSSTYLVKAGSTIVGNTLVFFLKAFKVYRGEHFYIYSIMLWNPSIHQLKISSNNSTDTFFLVKTLSFSS